MQSPRQTLAGESERNGSQALAELFVRLAPSPLVTATAPHVRAPASVDRLLSYFVIATVPALAVGLWNFGFQTLAAGSATGEPVTGWQVDLLVVLGLSVSPGSALACLALGLLYFLPLIVLAVSVALFWEVVFATVRRRPVDPGWLMCSWLFVLLLPAVLPLWLLVLGMSFGVVFGKQIFGGTGKYIVSPPLLGALFIHFGYPNAFTGEAAWLPAGLAADSTWAAIAAGGTDEASLQGVTWIQIFLGQEISALGTGSALACLIGGSFLVYTGAASHRTLLGALAGLVVTTLILDSSAVEDPAWHMPWFWQFASGGFAFGTVFLATDPSISPMTPAGRWIYGALIGVLTVIMRVANPSHPDGALPAILMAGLMVPVIDHFVLRAWTAQRRRRVGP